MWDKRDRRDPWYLTAFRVRVNTEQTDLESAAAIDVVNQPQ